VVECSDSYILPRTPERAEAEDNYKDRDKPYEESIKLLEGVLNSEDFKKLALPNMEKIKQRRRDWIEKLKRRINPFTCEMLSLLFKEEY
jgi:hypothetical protein